jgi:sulfide dehydrogenase [flavocytochrome c] flavoprotein subunit
MRSTRRTFLAGAAASGSLAIGGFPAIAQGSAGRVVVIGGGFGGATAARYLRLANPRLDVTLVERDDTYVTCPFSNYVIAGFRRLDDNVQRYHALGQKHGVKVVRGEATAIDTTGKSVTLGDGSKLAYDKLVVSPGIELNFGALPGYDQAAAEKMPHAWKAGPQTLLLRSQLEAMPDGGTFIVVCPGNPFRCPPGPYERISVVAWYLKAHKPRSKILVLDAKDAFSKQGLFQSAWESEFPGKITWVAGKDGGKVESVDPANLSVKAGFGVEKGAVVNVIPPQTAGRIAVAAGLAEGAWCPVDPATFASRKAADVFVIGDAAVAGAMPKSGSSANVQGKVAAAAIVAQLAGRQPEPPALFNICYSLVTPEYGISTTDIYTATADRGIVTVPNAGGVSVRAATAMNERKLEAEYTMGWYKSITADTWG